MHQPASSYVGYSRQTHGGITRTNRRRGSVLLQESPEGFWQAAPRDFEDSIVDPTHCSPHCFSSRASVPELSPARETHSQGKQPTESFYGGVWRLQGKRGGRERERKRERELWRFR